MRASARGVGAGDGGALEERLDGDARRDVGEPARRQRRRAADHEVGGAERRVLADEDLAGVDEAVDHARRRRRRRRRPGGAPGRSGWRRPRPSSSVVDEHAAAVDAERRPGGRRPAPPGRSASWRASSASVAVGDARRRGDEHDRRVGAVLGLDQQVGGEAHGVGGGVGDHQALGRAEQHHRRHAVALHLDLGARDRRRAGPDDLAHLRDRLGAEAEGGDAGRTVDAEHVARCRACGTRRARPGRPRRRRRGSAARRARSAGRRRRPPARRAGRRRSGSWPCPTARTARPTAIGVTFSPTVSPGSVSKLQSPCAGHACCSLNARQWAMASSIAASTVGGRRRPRRSRRR